MQLLSVLSCSPQWSQRPRGSVSIAAFLTSLTDCRWWFAVRKHMRQTNAGPTRGKHRRSLINANPKTPTRKPQPKLKPLQTEPNAKTEKTDMNCQLSKAGQRFSLFVHWFGLMQKVSKSSAVADVVHIHLSANQLQRLSTETKRVRVRETSP